MAMREKYTKPGESIHYYLVEWDPAKLSWESFRGQVLGATTPRPVRALSLSPPCTSLALRHVIGKELTVCEINGAPAGGR